MAGREPSRGAERHRQERKTVVCYAAMQKNRLMGRVRAGNEEVEEPGQLKGNKYIRERNPYPFCLKKADLARWF